MSRANEPIHPATIKELRAIFKDEPDSYVDVAYPGMTLREHYAGLAMQGILARSHLNTNSQSACAALAVEHADALLSALQAKP